MKHTKIEDKAHAQLKEYCDPNGIKLYKFVSQAVEEKVSRENARTAVENMRF